MQTKLGSNIDNFEVRQPKRFEIWLTHFFEKCWQRSLKFLINDIDAKKKIEKKKYFFIYFFYREACSAF